MVRVIFGEPVTFNPETDPTTVAQELERHFNTD
jgi:hypothetical protein